MNDQEILANAPEGATHVDRNGIYLRFNRDRVLELYHVNYRQFWQAATFIVPDRSLADIKAGVERDKRIAELERGLLDIVNECVEVMASAKNTLAVRKKFESGGYVKHYIVPRRIILNAKEMMEQGE